MICGFPDGFRSKYYCRLCTASSAQCEEMLEEDESLLRDIKSYEKEFAEKKCVESSIKEECIFNKINNFHIAENQSVDFMHDVPEGVAIYSMSKLTEGIMSSEKISLKTINNRIETFQFNEIEISNKPRPLYYSTGKKGGQKLKIKQSAAEMLCLIRYFGLMIGDLVSAKNPFWKLYLLLRDMVGIMTSPTLDRGQVQNLKEIIATIATKHQLQLCFATKFCAPVQTDVTLGEIGSLNAHSLLEKSIPTLHNELPVFTLKSIQVLGRKISAGTVILSRISENGPQFGIIKNIFHCKNVYLQLEELETVYFHHYFHAYCVQFVDNPTNILINVEIIPRSPPCLLITKSANKFVATKYDI